jgi:two-component system NtrC family sensor kinase
VLVRDVARALNRDQDPEEILRAVVTLLREHLPLRRATLWRREPSGIQVVAVSAPPDAPVSQWSDHPPAGADRVFLTHAGHRLGTLELEKEASAAPLDVDLLGLIADVLAPFLDGVLLSEDLASEVASRARELQEHRRLIALIIDSLPVGLYVIDREYRIVVWNRKRETGTQGMRRDQVMGRKVFEVLTRQPPDQLKAEYDTIFETGELLHRDQVVDIGGERRIFRQNKIPMRLDGETITHVITIGEDVTERQLAEQRITQSEKLAAVGQLAAGVMHEINNPLATIGACVAAIEARLGESADAGVREYLDVIEREVHRCTRIVDQLLDFSRPKAGTTVRRQPSPLNGLINDTLHLLKHHQRFKKLSVEKDFAPDLPAVLGDGERLIQVFMAILLNAADAMEKGGAVRIRTGHSPARDGELMVEIADSGVGIAPEALGKIFEPFYTTKPPGRGTGLGLTICYSIVEELGGRITVESKLGSGTTFRLFLPAQMDRAA